ncbi:MAG: formate dehydrogenase accessory sulfurtransferase FdhD, partial [Flavobacteriales bacterium]
MQTPWRAYGGKRHSSSEAGDIVHDTMTIESPLFIDVNGEAFTMTMQTPGHELELARGLMHTEGIVRSMEASVRMHARTNDSTGLVDRVDIEMDPSQIQSAPWSKRQLLSVASCGICGRTSMEELSGDLSSRVAEVLSSDVERMLDAMKLNQPHFAKTGGCHAAAAFDREGRSLEVMEDIGRHNAVDKVIGSLLMRQSL